MMRWRVSRFSLAAVVLALLTYPVVGQQPNPPLVFGKFAGQSAPTPTIDQLLDRLAEMRKQRGELERQERELVISLQEKLREQISKLNQMGVQLQAPTPLAPIHPAAPGVVPIVPPTSQPTPARPPSLTEELQAAYASDKSSGRGGVDDLHGLARIYSNAGEALEKARPPTVGHLRNGLDISIRVRLKGNLPTVLALTRQRLALHLPPDNTAMTPENAVACKLALAELAGALEKVSP